MRVMCFSFYLSHFVFFLLLSLILSFYLSLSLLSLSFSPSISLRVFLFPLIPSFRLPLPLSLLFLLPLILSFYHSLSLFFLLLLILTFHLLLRFIFPLPPIISSWISLSFRILSLHFSFLPSFYLVTRWLLNFELLNNDVDFLCVSLFFYYYSSTFSFERNEKINMQMSFVLWVIILENI